MDKLKYFKFQVKWDDIWMDNPYSYPLALRQQDIQPCIEDIDLGDNGRLIPISELEALSRSQINICWLVDSSWRNIVKNLEQ